MPQILITGSNGYVGNFLAEYLTKKGYAVIGLDKHSDPRQKSYKNFAFHACDVREKEKLKKIFLEEKPTHVIHLAYLMDPQHSRKFEYDVDVHGSLNVFEAANETKAVKQFIHFSSTSAYGGFPDNKPWITEEQALRPRDWVYAQNKKIVEEAYAKSPKRKGLKVINVRMCTAVGPSYYKSGGVVKTLAKSPLGLFLDGKDTILQFIHEDDVKSLIELIINDDSVEGTFNLAPDSYAATKELNPQKIFLRIPKMLFKGALLILWSLHLSPVSPTSVNLVAHGIVASPKKLMGRYNYKFKYSTKEAYGHAVRERMKNGTL